MKNGIAVGLLFAIIALSVGCGSDDKSSGLCIADYGSVVECFDCWDKSLCEESSSRTWVDGQDSCPSAGYSSPSGNECGYTN